MTNICIELDGTAMLRDNVTLVLGNADVVLCPHSISTKYIVSAKYFTQPRHTLYKRPTSKVLSLEFTKDCPCAHCRRSHALGTQWCLGQCWVPITSHAVRDHINNIPVPSAHPIELRRLYGLSIEGLLRLIDGDPAGSINPLYPKWVNGWYNEHIKNEGECYYTPPSTPPTAEDGEPLPRAPPTAEAEASPPRDLPTAKAGVKSSAMQYRHASLPTVQHLYRTYGDPSKRGRSYHLEDADVRNLNTAAAQSRVEGTTYYSYHGHTDRYQRNATYRKECENHIPPTSEHLYWEDGSYTYKW